MLEATSVAFTIQPAGQASSAPFLVTAISAATFSSEKTTVVETSPQDKDDIVNSRTGPFSLCSLCT